MAAVVITTTPKYKNRKLYILYIRNVLEVSSSAQVQFCMSWNSRYICILIIQKGRKRGMWREERGGGRRWRESETKEQNDESIRLQREEQNLQYFAIIRL